MIRRVTHEQVTLLKKQVVGLQRQLALARADLKRTHTAQAAHRALPLFATRGRLTSAGVLVGEALNLACHLSQDARDVIQGKVIVESLMLAKGHTLSTAADRDYRLDAYDDEGRFVFALTAAELADRNACWSANARLVSDMGFVGRDVLLVGPDLN